jgi:hypothetical protein
MWKDQYSCLVIIDVSIFLQLMVELIFLRESFSSGEWKSWAIITVVATYTKVINAVI